MNMKECFDQCGDDDVPYLDGHFNWHDEHTKAKLASLGCAVDVKAALSDKWQIQHTKPKVMPVEYLVDEYCKNHSYDLRTTKECTLKIAKECDKNGQLKEWVRHKELREAVSGYVLGHHHIDVLHKELKALTPPEA